MKYKTKPIQRAEIREAVERKFRARGGILFHGLLFVLGSGLFLAFLPAAWERLFDFRYGAELQDLVVLYGTLSTSFAFHFFRYHFKHGAGYRRHQAQTAARLNRQLLRSAPEEWEDQEELIRMQQKDKLKNRRLLFQHLTLFIGISSMMILVRVSHIARWEPIGWDAMNPFFSFIGVWGIGWLTHALRYFFAYGYSAEKRQTRIDAEVAREMAALTQIEAVAATSGSDGEPRTTNQPSLDGVSLEELALGEAKIEDRASQ